MHKNRRLIRAPWWDYQWGASYFITINTWERIPFFGKVIDHKVRLSTPGKISKQCWQEIEVHFTKVSLGPFVVMPEHIHGIINIAVDNDLNLKRKINRFQNQGKSSISSIIGSFKSAASRKIHPLCPEFRWQFRFYDRIIRNEREYCETVRYILDNPLSYKGQ